MNEINGIGMANNSRSIVAGLGTRGCARIQSKTELATRQTHTAHHRTHLQTDLLLRSGLRMRSQLLFIARTCWHQDTCTASC